MNLTFRFAEAKDADSFSRWAAENPQIDRKDIEAATKESNPTTTFLVIENDGQPVMFMPVYFAMRIGYLAFNPETDRLTRETAMEYMLKAVQAFAGLYSVTSIDTLTKSGIPVAEWARQHGFNADPRELFTLKLNPSPQGFDKGE